MQTTAPRLWVYQIKQYGGEFRFILAENEEVAKKYVGKEERLVAKESLEQILGGEVKIIYEKG
jgi:hypothetical protein